MLEVNEENFDKEVLKCDKPVVVDFWAPWCGPCKILGPIFEKVSEQVSGMKFAKMNVDENQGLAQQMSILGIPCMIVFKNGEESERIVGILEEDKLKAKLESLI